MRYLSVCSGMEAASVAWHPLGWTPVGFSEIEPFPCAILKHRFPNTPNYGSLTEHASWPLQPGSIDLLVGGTPCQSFSVAGLRKGLADPRGNLALTFLALADRLKPKWIIWENVPGVLSSGGGRDFGSFLGALVELGYGFAYRVLDAQHFGVPQRRRRVFVVACLGDWKAAAEILSIAEGLSGYLAKGKQTRKGSSSDAKSSVGADGLQRTVGTLCADTHPGAYSGQDAYTGRLIPQATSHWEGSGIHPTLNRGGQGQIGYSNQEVFSQQGGGLVPAMMFKVRGGSPVETGEQGGTPGKGAGKGFLGSEEKAFTIATAPDQWLAQAIPIDDGRAIEKHQNGLGVGKPGDPAYTLDTLGAQSVAIPYRKSKQASSTTDNETWVEADASNTLNNFDLGDTRTTHAVVACSDVSPTISSGAPFSKTGNERVECEAFIVQASELRLRGQITEKDVCPTLTAGAKQGDTDPLAVHPIAFQPGNLRREARADPSTETFPTLTKDSGDQSPHVATPMAVRRLTPTECERLQGFPDNWSQIPWKGKPADQCPDGPRYKACGNSMAVPVMRWIGERIAAVESSSHA